MFFSCSSHVSWRFPRHKHVRAWGGPLSVESNQNELDHQPDDQRCAGGSGDRQPSSLLGCKKRAGSVLRMIRLTQTLRRLSHDIWHWQAHGCAFSSATMLWYSLSAQPGRKVAVLDISWMRKLGNEKEEE